MSVRGLRRWEKEKAPRGSALASRISVALGILFTAVCASGDTRPPIEIPALHEAQAHDAAIVVLDGQLKRGEWEAARAAATSLLERSKSTFHGSTQRALARLVIAEARLGHQEEALWQLQALGAMGGASLMEPLLALAGLEEAQLKGLPLRAYDEIPAGVERLAAHSGLTLARRIGGVVPAGNAGCTSARGPLWARLQAVIDPQGHLTQPAIVGPSVTYSYEILKAARGWTFQPALRDGVPVASLYDETINPPGGMSLREVGAGVPDLTAIAPLLEAGQFPAAEAKIEQQWHANLEAGAPSRPEAVKLLALRALARAAHDEPNEQRQAICLWEAAQGEEPELYHLDLAPFGRAGKLLAPHRFGEVRVNPGGAARDAAPPDARIERPEVIRESRRAPRMRLPATSYSARRVFIEAIVDDQGAVREPILIDRPEGMHGLDLEALEAVCAWRFHPASRAGKPLGVLYVLTLSVGTGSGEKPAP